MDTAGETGGPVCASGFARTRLGRAALGLALAVLLPGIPICLHAASEAGKTQQGGANGLRIGYVDVQRVFAEATFVRALLDDLDKSLDAQREKIAQKQEAYGRLVDEVRRQQAVLSESERVEKRRKSRLLLMEIEDETEALNLTISKSKKKTDPALDRIKQAIEDLAQEEGYDLILDGELLVYGSPGADLSGKVIERLNKSEKPSGKAGGSSRPPATAP